MPDEVMESAPEPQEAEAPPAPKLSEPSGGQRPSEPEQEVRGILTRLAEKMESLEVSLQEQVRREVQSTKDRRFAKQEQELAEIKAYLDASGGDIKKAAREMQLDEILSQGRLPREDRGGSDWERDWNQGSESILRSALDDFGVKVDRSDPEYREIVGRTYNSPADAFAALNRLVARRVKGESAPAAAAATEGSAPASPPTADIGELTNRVQQLRLAGKWKELEVANNELKEALSKLG